MIVWNTLYAISLFSCETKILPWNKMPIIEYTSFMILFPIIGLMADCWVGRYRILKAGLYLLLIAIIFKTMGKLVFQILCLLQ